MATKNDENVFTSPWSDSDMVLVVKDQELHVHKWILKSQSPVFKAMLDGHFQEAGQDKISLKGKDLQSMVQFIKELYPPSMIRQVKSPLNDKSLLSIMALADEYQCVNLIQQCIDEAKITQENVWQILPYAVRYYQTALPRMYDVINWCAPTTKLEKLLPELEVNLVKETSNPILLAKCRFLESSVVKMQDAIVRLISDFLTQKNIADDTKTSLNSTQKSLDDARKKIEFLEVPKKDTRSRSSYRDGNTSVTNTFKLKDDGYFDCVDDIDMTFTGDARCSHRVGVEDVNKIKSCLSCKEKYKEKFLVPIPSCKNTQNFLNMLESGDDVATAVREQK